MRDLKECQAEVFRRSEKRINEGKRRRRHICIAGVSVVACFALAFTALPQILGDPHAQGGGMEDLVEEKYESASCSVAEITVSSRDVFRSYTDSDDVLRIYDRLNACTAMETAPEGDETDGAEGAGTNEAPSVDNFVEDLYSSGISAGGMLSGAADLTITIVMREGDRVVYCLSGNTLTDLQTNKTFFPHRDQLDALRDLLGISKG